MYRTILLVFILSLSSVSSYANSAGAAPASYLLQLTSNLGCEKLDIELVSQSDDKRHKLTYTTSAFAAVDVPAGGYAFGDVTCTSKDGTNSFDLLSEKVKPIYLSAGKAYYGGRLIFQEVKAKDANATPDVLEECTNVMSGARGDTDSECRDGVGVDTSAQISRQINLYVPEVSDKELTTIRSALAVTKDQLLYLPLKG